MGLALKLVSGFSIQEISTALMITTASAEKRIYRAIGVLREQAVELADLNHAKMLERVDAVESTIYLMFNEGYASLSNSAVLRRDMCDEAIRLCRMLVAQRTADEHQALARPSTSALLALMLMHLARFDARVGDDGALILMQDQDRGLWDYSKIREAMDWMTISTAEPQMTRYHIEAAIAWEHVRAIQFESVAWQRIYELYTLLDRLQPGPMIRLNKAIAAMYAHGNDEGLRQLTIIDVQDRRRLRPWWDGALATVYQRLGDYRVAVAHFQDAHTLTSSPALKTFFAQRMAAAERLLADHSTAAFVSEP